MKRLKKIIATIAVFSIAISMMGCKMIEKTPEAIAKTTIAKVGSEKITKGNLDQEFKQYDQMLKQQYGEDYESNEEVSAQVKEMKQKLLNNLVDKSILSQKASEAGFMPTEDEINKKVEENMKQFTGEDSDKEQYKQFLEYYGFTEESFLEYQKNEAKIGLIIEKMTKDVKITDEEIQNYYNENKDTEYTTEGPIDYDKSLQVANEIESQLSSGSDFAEVAKEKSTDPGSKDNGGSLGFINYDDTQYVAEFMDGFKNLKEGEISKPVKSDFGYHIIKVTGVTDKGAEVSHILVSEKGEGTVTPFEDVKESIKANLVQQKNNAVYSEKLEEWKKGLTIKTYEDRL